MRPYRKEKVASLVLRIVSEAIAHRLQDPRVAPLTTVTRVDITGDLLTAKVYLSIQGDAAAERRTLAAVRHAAGYLQRMVAQQMSMRHCPELRFDIDESAKGVRRTMELLAENRRREPQLYEPEPGDAAGGFPATDPQNPVFGDPEDSVDGDPEDSRDGDPGGSLDGDPDAPGVPE